MVASLLLQSTGFRCTGRELQHVGAVVVAHERASMGSVVVAHGFSCSEACGSFLDQGSSQCPLHCKTDS